MSNWSGTAIAIAIVVLGLSIYGAAVRLGAAIANSTSMTAANMGRYWLAQGYLEDDSALTYRLDTVTGEVTWTLSSQEGDAVTSTAWKQVGQSSPLGN